MEYVITWELLNLLGSRIVVGIVGVAHLFAAYDADGVRIVGELFLTHVRVHDVQVLDGSA